VWVIGRAPDCDVVLDFPIVSARHCRVRNIEGAYEVEDLGSANGTHVHHVGNRISGSVRVPRDAAVFLGSYRFPLSSLPGGALAGGTKQRVSKGCGTLQQEIRISSKRVVIGRDPAADVVIDHPHVSRRHACIEVKAGNYILTDLGSGNGVFVNGRRVRSAVLKPSDEISLGTHKFVFTADKSICSRNYSGDVTVAADGLCVKVQDATTNRPKTLIQDVSFTVYPGELVGVMGPSGSGKTTLLHAMLGIIPPASGKCLLNGIDMAAHFDSVRAFIGYVPQDDIIHPELTVREALTYAGRLRLQSDVGTRELESRVDRTLAMVGLSEAAGVLVGSPDKKGISGGQRKRLNIALELLSEPSLLFLDEPTSGLSSEDAVSLLQELRKLTNEGKTVILTIHQPGYRIYSTLDNVLILTGKTKADKEAGVQGHMPGRLAYYGPAVANFGAPESVKDDSITFFNPEVARLPLGERPEVLKDPEAPLAGMDRKPSAHWVDSYRRHSLCKEYVTSRTPVGPSSTGRAKRARGQVVNPLAQWLVLTQRYALTKLRDLGATLGLLAQAPIIAALLSIVFGKSDPYDIPVFLLVVVAIWFGCINSVTEIVKERAIYKRERMVFLEIVPYVMSKAGVLGLLSLVQSAILLGILKWSLDLHGAFLPMLGIMLLCSVGGLALGLLLSAVRPTLGSAMSILPIVLTVQIVLGGAMQPLPDMDVLPKDVRIPQWAASITLSRWGFEALLSIEEEARRKQWERDGCVPPACTFHAPEIPTASNAVPPAGTAAQTGVAGSPESPAAPQAPPERERLVPRRDSGAKCMQFPQIPVCCKFQEFQLVGTPEDTKVKWSKECTEKSEFSRWKDVPLSSVSGNACALAVIVILSFVGLLVALKYRD